MCVLKLEWAERLRVLDDVNAAVDTCAGEQDVRYAAHDALAELFNEQHDDECLSAVTAKHVDNFITAIEQACAQLALAASTFSAPAQQQSSFPTLVSTTPADVREYYAQREARMRALVAMTPYTGVRSKPIDIAGQSRTGGLTCDDESLSDSVSSSGSV